METVLLNDRYRLVELIGAGGMAVVYSGVDTLLQRRVAVKVLREEYAGDPAFLARFRREAQAAANLDHPNVVTVYDVGQDGERHYIVMEYVDGQDLKTLIRREGRLSVGRALDLAIQVCYGAGHAHKAGVIHCDIKPQNVLVTEDGVAKVTDFGIARALSASGLTESETVWGSPLYFSPEQAAGEPPSPASDVYSIGVILYEMLAGAPPFQAEKSAALALKHLREEPPPLGTRNPQVAPGLEWIVRKVLAKEPSARYRTAEQLAHILEEYRKHGEEVTGFQPAVSPGTLSPWSSADRTAKVEPSGAPQPGIDWTTVVLGAIALIAVLGLIPLWWLVYQAYAALPSLPPTPTRGPLATLTVQKQMARVPDVVGVQVAEARSLLEDARLRFIVEERDAPGVEPGVVIEQRPSPYTLVALDTEVSLVVSRVRRELAMPSVLASPLQDGQSKLEAEGLLVVVTPVWSTEPEGLIVRQEPEAGTTVYGGDTVTLTVSGSADMFIELKANLADVIELTGAQLQKKTFRPGEVVRVRLVWRALRPVQQDAVVFVHLIDARDPGGPPVAQQDKSPVVPTLEWKPGDVIDDPHQFRIKDSQSAGIYQVRVGMYPSDQPNSRLPVVDAGLTTAEQNSILVGEIEIAP